MSICLICKKEKSSGGEQKVYTGRFLSTSQSSSMIRTVYTDFLEHSFFVCNDCNRKDNLIYSLIVGPTLLLMTCLGILGILLNPYFCLASFLVIIPGLGVLLFFQKVVFHIDIDKSLKEEAILQRKVTGETGIHAFTESEYSSLVKVQRGG
jgi:hypothetical protein